MKKYIYPLAITAAMLATACSDDVVNDVDQPVPDSQKEMISFSLGDNAGTRAGFTGADTKIVMRIQSDSNVSGQAAKYTRTVATGQKQADGTVYSEVVFVSTSEANNVRYWDDAHGRNSLLSVFAVAIPNSSDLNTDILNAGDASKEWGTTASHELASDWTVSKVQDNDKQAKEDLVYSNNIKEGGKNGVYTYDFTNDKYTPTKGATGHADGQMKFQLKDSQDPTSPGKFNRGHLVFKHALSRLTIELVKSTGFADSDPFNFKESTQITLLGMPTKGKLNVATGEWTVAAGAESHANITSLYKTSSETTPATAAGTYMAQVLPGYSFMENSDVNVLSFTIDGNTYYVTQKDIFAALNTSDNTTGTDPKIKVEQTTDATPVKYIQMKEGKNYSLKINVEKAKIQNITATLADWATVTAEDKTPSNSRITLSLANPTGSEVCNSFDLYRLPQTRTESENESAFAGTEWKGNYTDFVTTNSSESDATKKLTKESDNTWTSPWYYKDNLTYYHFRTVNEGTVINVNSTATDDYFEITSGTTDYHWGAPMKYTSGDDFKYNITSGENEGYTNALYPAIGSTTSDIKIQEIHMMSSIEVILKTVSGDEGVKLLDGTNGSKVELTYFAETGNVKMGNGFITPSSTIKNKQEITSPATSDYYKTATTETKPFTYYVVPQPLVRAGSTNNRVGITITTPDNNTYYVVEDLASITPSSVGSQAGQQHATSSAIERWYPGHKYTYTFTLKKKKIESITCSVADWVTVTAGNTDLNLEGVIPPATTGGGSTD